MLLTNFHWGIQRRLGDKWLFNVNAGVGFAGDFSSKIGKFYSAFGLNF